MRRRRWAAATAVLLLATAASACGGGDDDTAEPAATPVPTTAVPAATPTTEAMATPTTEAMATPTTEAMATPTTEAMATPTTEGMTDGEPRVLEIGADDSEGFDRDRLRMSAGETVTVVFDNRDDGGEPHNWHVVVGDDEYATTIAQGPDVQEVTFTVNDAGEYMFFCDTHLGQMEGTLFVDP
jgi:plastocyanin